MKKKRVPLRKGSESMQRARAALKQRIDVSIRELPRCEEAARFWSERAWSELAAVPAMSQTSLALLRQNSDLDALGAVMQIGADEVRHTELSRDLADALGGYIEEIPEGSRYEPQRLGDPMNVPLPFWIVANGCISETISLALMRARLANTSDPTAYSVLSSVIKDEAAHQKIGWLLAERVLPDVSRSVKTELSEYAMAMFEVVGCTFATAGLEGKAREDARHIREVTAQLGLGACMPDIEDEIVRDTIESDIVPRFAQLGIQI